MARHIALTALLTNFTLALVNNPLINLAVYFTNWGMLSSLFLTLLVLKCTSDPDIKEKKGWLASTHIMFELATSINAIVCAIYWPTIHF